MTRQRGVRFFWEPVSAHKTHKMELSLYDGGVASVNIKSRVVSLRLIAPLLMADVMVEDVMTLIASGSGAELISDSRTTH